MEKQRIEERRSEEEREREEREARKKKAKAGNGKRVQDQTGRDETAEEGKDDDSTAESAQSAAVVVEEQNKPEAFNISNEEAVRRLRNKGQPIRLFGETDKERRLRVRALELIEERTEGQRNDFMRAMDGMEMGLDLQEIEKNKIKGKGEAKEGEGEELEKKKKAGEENVLVDMKLVKEDPHKIYPQIYHALKASPLFLPFPLHP